jgi:hypothetical protein
MASENRLPNEDMLVPQTGHPIPGGLFCSQEIAMKPTLQRSLFEVEEATAERKLEPASSPVVTPALEIVKQSPSPSVHHASPPTPEEWMACVKVDDCEWVAFLRKHGRVPHLSDAKKPWDYPGWLMYYRVLAEEHLDIPKRWDYWFRTMIAGRLLDEPIPQMRFTGEGGERSEGYKLIDQWIHLIDRYGGGWSSPMTVLLDWLLWGFCLSADKPSLSAELNEQLYRSVNIGPLLLEPHDYFGEWIANQKGKWNPRAFYPTPEHVVELMIQINFSV